MMKKNLSYFLFIISLVPQFLFENYLFMVAAVFVLGFVSGYLSEKQNVFLKVFFLEIIVYTLILIFCGQRIFYIHEIISKFQISDSILYTFLIIFNGLNIAIIFYLGSKVSTLMTFFVKVIYDSNRERSENKL